jgi:FMN phosphatase YigB (HAD superfamily)
MPGVLFDLDGTLLDVKVSDFLSRYFLALKVVVAPQFPGVDLLPAVLASTDAMQRPHPGKTNQEVFYRDFKARTGVDLETNWPVFERFYREVFPTLGADYGPVAGAREAIAAVRGLGWRVAVATQPIFPLVAIEHRLRWAGLADVRFDAITSYEVMQACKPQPAFFTQVCGMIGCAPRDCIMVGDDDAADMAAGELGIRTYFVGQGAAQSDHTGTLADLPAFLRRLRREGWSHPAGARPTGSGRRHA